MNQFSENEVGCAICEKHRGRGPLAGPVIYRDGLVVVTHRPPEFDATAVPGYLFVETQRHVAGLAHLLESEVNAVAKASWRAALALTVELNPENVFSLIAGRSVSHFHQHVFPRPRGTPDHIAWNDVDSWGSRPLVAAAGVYDLCERLRTHFVKRL